MGSSSIQRVDEDYFTRKMGCSCFQISVWIEVFEGWGATWNIVHGFMLLFFWVVSHL